MSTYNRRIYLSDTDAAGVVYFASLLSICHEAYEASLEAAAIDLKSFFSNPKMVIPIVHAEIDFLGPLFCGDRVTIKLSCVQLKDTEFEITYRISVSVSPEICVAKAKTKHVCINPSTRRRTQLSESIVKWLH